MYSILIQELKFQVLASQPSQIMFKIILVEHIPPNCRDFSDDWDRWGSKIITVYSAIRSTERPAYKQYKFKLNIWSIVSIWCRLPQMLACTIYRRKKNFQKKIQKKSKYNTVFFFALFQTVQKWIEFWVTCSI